MIGMYEKEKTKTELLTMSAYLKYKTWIIIWFEVDKGLRSLINLRKRNTNSFTILLIIDFRTGKNLIFNPRFLGIYASQNTEIIFVSILWHSFI